MKEKIIKAIIDFDEENNILSGDARDIDIYKLADFICKSLSKTK